ncbi:MAG: recG [Chloroflexi bacterium]|nr:recG [Chloroflexota bacterium]
MHRDLAADAASALATLRNVLQLEEQRAYDDRAIVGGLARLVARLADDLALADDLLRRVQRYDEQNPHQRAATLAALRAATDSRKEPALPTPPATPEQTNAAPAYAVGGRTRTRKTIILNPDSPISALPGVGPTRAKRLASLGISTVGDLRFHLPNRYQAYPPPLPASQLGFQHLASFEGIVRRVDVAALPGRRFRITAILADSTGSIAASWIRAGGVPSGISEGLRLAVSGRLDTYGRQAHFDNPEFEPADAPALNTRRTVPVYPLTSGISQPFVRSIVHTAIEALPPIAETLPEWLRAEESLVSLNDAIRQVHWPDSAEELEAARHRLAFEEVVPISLLVLGRRLAWQETPAQRIDPPWPLLADFRTRLPFSLTRGQQRALSTILQDMAEPRPMVRLLQGEVGSGKTVVAAMALLAAVANGGQAAIVAPTEILAEQHLRTLTELYRGTQPAIEAALGRQVRLALLSGALSRRDRLQTLEAIREGEIDLVVGTHAVIEKDVEFNRLLLAVVDEQHRFGVSQRVALRRKGDNPHVLLMTATPIPRTLALTLYGDLDISTIDELPSGRMPVETTLLRPLGRANAYERVRSEVAEGRQAFVICPLVEGSAVVEARAAVTEYERLQRAELSELKLALLHGRMRPSEKDEVMQAFAAGAYNVLVTTSVVEVGVDVPNATVMIIEDAEHFGLAQLHQFRGRVGRGAHQAWCFLLAGNESPESLSRLEAVTRSSNGLDLAEEDLRIRGPGDYFGLKQSGFPMLRVARLTDLEFVQRVREAAGRILKRDPTLSEPDHAHLAAAVRALGSDAGEAN